MAVTTNHVMAPGRLPGCPQPKALCIQTFARCKSLGLVERHTCRHLSACLSGRPTQHAPRTLCRRHALAIPLTVDTQHSPTHPTTNPDHTSPNHSPSHNGHSPSHSGHSPSHNGHSPSHNGHSPLGAAPPPPPPTAAAAVIARYPAVPPLPPPPSAGGLKTVVPYLLRLALAERALGWRLAAAAGCMLVAKMAGISLPLVFKAAVDAMATGGASAAAPAALAAALTYAALDCVRVVAKEAQFPLFAPVSQAVTRRVAYHTFGHVLGLGAAFHADRRTGRVSRVLERGTRSIAVLYRALIFTFLPTGLELAAVGALLAGRFGPGLAALLGATFAAYCAWTVAMTQAATEVRKEVNSLDNAASSQAVDALLGVEAVALFGNTRLEVGQYDTQLTAYQSASLRTERLAAALNAGQGLILAGGMGCLLAAIVGSGTATGGDLVLASGLVAQLWAPLQFLGWFYRELRASLVDMEEFFAILRTRPSVPDGHLALPPAPPAPAAPAGARREGAAAEGRAGASGRHAAVGDDVGEAAADGRIGSGAEASTSGGGGGVSWGGPGGLEIELRDVWFGYTPERTILRGVSLRVAPGESVAVVGGSGSGKSTLLRLITRLYDVWDTRDGATHGSGGDHPNPAATSGEAHEYAGSRGSSDDINGSSDGANGSSDGVGGHGHLSGGCVLVNGVDVRQLRLEELRAAIAVVPQDTALRYESIRENIRYGAPGASDAEVEAAAAAARLHDTVASLPEGYDTVVGERGLKLSGGEKQRVAIARAFLRQPRLLICDEATSALDSATEAGIMRQLGELAKGRSSLFVAHRLSTVRNCDRIVVLRAGAVVEEGSHAQLMEKGGEYARMWELQAHEGPDAAPADGGVTDSGEYDDIEVAAPPPPPKSQPLTSVAAAVPR